MSLPRSRCRIAPTARLRSSRSWLTMSTVCGIGAQIALEPERAFEIEVVGRLVEQQDLGLEEQHGARARRACASRPTARRTGAAALRRRSRGRRGSARRARARSARRCRRGARGSRRCDAASWADSASASSAARSVSAASTQSMRLSVAARRLLRDVPDARAAFGTVMEPIVGAEIAADELQQRRLAGAVAADEADLVAGRDAGGGILRRSGAPRCGSSGR